MPFEIKTGDFLKYEAEIMVIPTSQDGVMPLTMIGRKVFKVAGYDKMNEARHSMGRINFGDIVVTSGFDLNVQNVIHACVPAWHSKNKKTDSLSALKSCYSNALHWAEQKGINSISFPLLGSGFPRELAEEAASAAIRTHLKFCESCMNVLLVLPPSYEPVYEDQTKSESPITENYIDCYAEYDIRFEENFRNSGLPRYAFCEKYVDKLLTDRITNAERLAKTIDYDKGALSNFRNGKLKTPSKHRVIAMAIYMGLSDEERYNFIRSVGHNKYPEDERDRIVEKLIRSGYRDFESVNNELCRINPAFDLKAKTKKDKKKDRLMEK